MGWNHIWSSIFIFIQDILFDILFDFNGHGNLKPSYFKEVIFVSRTKFLLWVLFLLKKLEIEKTQPNFVTSIFKTDIKIVGLVFSICNFFVNKTAKRRKLVLKKIPTWKKKSGFGQNLRKLNTSLRIWTHCAWLPVGFTGDLVVSCSNKKYFFKFDNCVIDTWVVYPMHSVQ